MEDRQQNSYPRGFDTFSHNFNAAYGQSLGSTLGKGTGGFVIAGTTLAAKYGYDSYKAKKNQKSKNSESESEEI